MVHVEKAKSRKRSSISTLITGGDGGRDALLIMVVTPLHPTSLIIDACP
jgi:hypothetical protein